MLEGIMWDEVSRLHAHHGDVSIEMRILKLTEEVGEAAEAFIGLREWPARHRVQPLPASAAEIWLTSSPLARDGAAPGLTVP